MSSDETRLALLEHRVEELQAQQDRFVSHFDSESRARDHLKDRAALIEKSLARIEDRMEGSRWNVTAITSVISAAAALIMALIMLMK